MYQYQSEDTIVALATPPGTSAIGVIRLGGVKAFEVFKKIWKGKNLQTSAGHTAHFGKIVFEGKVLDEVLATIFRAPKSYTGQDLIEISCHGSPYILDQVTQALVFSGARMAEPGEFTLRAFVNAKLDLTQAEAVADLIAANSAASLKAAMYQMRGGFSAEIKALRTELLNFASLVELELDFSEEDVEFADRGALNALMLNIRQVCERLIASFTQGQVMKNGFPTVIAGKPNAGKSTLLNALLNEERAIVSEVAGTTRDTVEETLQIGGISFRLIDTAGIRQNTDSHIESIGIQKALEKIDTAALVIYLFDASKVSKQELAQELEGFDQGKAHWLLVANKWDACNEEAKAHWQAEPVIRISAANKEIKELETALFNLAQNAQLTESDGMVSNSRHVQALWQTKEAIASAETGMAIGLSGDLLAEHIREATYHLGTITGEISNDELLGNIFGKFCIGK